MLDCGKKRMYVNDNFGNENLIRVGSDPYGSCFFFSLMNTMKDRKDKYKTKSKKSKKQFIKKLRELLSENLNEDKWKALEVSKVDTISFRGIFCQMLIF